MKRTPMTLRGAEALRAELKRLKSEVRPAIIKAIAEARGHGDLSENAEYHAAREQQGFIEGRIKEIEHRLSHTEVIDVAKLPQTGKVVFGTTTRWSARTRPTFAPGVSRSLPPSPGRWSASPRERSWTWRRRAARARTRSWQCASPERGASAT